MSFPIPEAQELEALATTPSPAPAKATALRTPGKTSAPASIAEGLAGQMKGALEKAQKKRRAKAEKADDGEEEGGDGEKSESGEDDDADPGAKEPPKPKKRARSTAAPAVAPAEVDTISTGPTETVEEVEVPAEGSKVTYKGGTISRKAGMFVVLVPKRVSKDDKALTVEKKIGKSTAETAFMAAKKYIDERVKT